MIQVTTFEVRQGGVQPKASGCPTSTIDNYVIQTFGAWKKTLDVYDAKTELLKSSDFQGLRYGDPEEESFRNSTYIQASYSCRALRDTDGTVVYQANEEHVPEFVDESEVPGWS